ncbi:tetratricopeptide repeat protein [Parvibaculum sp.]|uniref:tetratricopeptide repeat protein n=1 Tax=Parvibaculum sp. TaxID=2024848 RepID=UPI00391BC898
MSERNIQFGSRAGLLVILCAVAIAITACSGGGAARKRDAEGRVIPTLAEQDPSGTLYARAVSRAAAGDCTDDTLNVLTCFAYRGHGYEGAQTALGQCYLASGNPAEGAEWIRRAANAGWADAQRQLALLYLRGEGVSQNAVEGAKWARLYSRNARLLALGVQPDLSVAEEFRGAMTSEENARSEQLAVNWVPSYWSATTEPDQNVLRSCAVEGRRPPAQRPEIVTAPDPY